jgi:sigma-B regulation protein RsbU (phosphoserine phosphatase)
MDKKTRVLLVDDQAIVGEQIRQIIEGLDDFEYRFCQHPGEALKAAIDFKPTVILQDLTMPDIDGLTLVKFYRANRELKNVPVMVLSSKYEPEVKVQAFQAGANDYFEKRFDIPDIEKELIARLRYHSNAYLVQSERDEAYDALEKEIKKAAEYIHSILPESLSDDRIKTDWRHIPSTSLSGDSFDYAWIDDKNFAFYLLDVCGHGVGSALLSISAVNVIRSSTLSKEDFKQPAKVLSFLNERFKMSEQNELYFTIWYGVYNTDEHTIKYAGGAHPPAIIKRGNDIINLESQNFLIGGIPNFQFTEDVITIDSQTELFIFSDGAYEIMKPDGGMWTHEELGEFIKNNDSETVLDDLYKHLQYLGDSIHLEDDYTILKLTFK